MTIRATPQHAPALSRDYLIMRRSWWLALAACGRLHFDPTTDVADAVCTGPQLRDASCQLVLPNGVCALGGPGCAGEACVAIAGPRCLPSMLCSCPTHSCLVDQLLTNVDNNLLPNVTCSMPFTAAGAPCTSMVTVDASLLLGSGRACVSASVGTTEQDFLRLGPTVQATIQNLRAPCTFDLVVAGTLTNQGVAIELLQLEIDNGSYMIVPIKAEALLTTACTPAAACTTSRGVDPSDPVFSCAM